MCLVGGKSTTTLPKWRLDKFNGDVMNPMGLILKKKKHQQKQIQDEQKNT